MCAETASPAHNLFRALALRGESAVMSGARARDCHAHTHTLSLCADGGMYKTKELARSESSIPDERMLWRYEARSLRLMEMFDEADAAIQKRPLPHTSRIPADFDFNKAIDQACHRSCSELYTAYDRCMGKKKGDFQKCTGWYMPSPSYLPWYALPFGLYEGFASSWNHLALLPASTVVAIFLFGIEELAVQLEGTSPHISPHLPTSPRISLCCPARRVPTLRLQLWASCLPS